MSAATGERPQGRAPSVSRRRRCHPSAVRSSRRTSRTGLAQAEDPPAEPGTQLNGKGRTIAIAIYDGTKYGSAMKTLISMDPVGRLVLPKSIRRSLNLARTAVFEAEVLGNRLELTLAEPEPTKLRRKGKLLVVPRRGVAVDAVKGVEETRKDRS